MPKRSEIVRNLGLEATMARLILVLFVALGGAVVSAQQETPAIPWDTCPCEGELGTMATVSVPEGFLFVGKEGVKALLDATQNPASGNELGALTPSGQDSNWFVLFAYNQTGHVRDDEKDSIDADAVLRSLRQSTEAANDIRRERGWSPLEITGWERTPFYDPASHNLTWAIDATSDGERVVNYNVRLLGRGGVMSAELIGSPSDLPAAIPEFNRILRDFSFTNGNRYAEFRPGDQVASYGLTALIAGGAGAAAVKSGLLAKIWKLLVFGAIALVSAIKKIVHSITAKRAQHTVDSVVNG
jgi:uncharacterized membrane-anchored protein